MTRLRASPGVKARRARARAVVRAGRAHALLEAAERARGRHLDHALALAREARQLGELDGDARAQGRAWRIEGDVHAAQARYLDATLAARKAWRLAADAGEPAEASEALLTVANATLAMGDNGGALRAYRKALAEAERAGEPARIGPLRGVGRVLWALGRKAEAARYYAAALKLAEKHRLHRIAGSLHIGLGNIAWEPGRDAETADRHYRAADAAYAKVGDDAGRCAVAGNRAGMYSDAGRLAEARATLRDGLRLARACRDWRSAIYIRINYGELLAREGKRDAARRQLGIAERLALKRGEKHALNAAREALGELSGP